MASIAVLDVTERIAPFEEPEVSDAMTTATSRSGRRPQVRPGLG